MTALVTGASGGIGGGIAVELAHRGAQVVVSGRNRDKLELLHTKLQTYNDFSHAVAVCDMRDPSGINSLARTAATHSGGVDILVNAAGVSHDSLLLRLKDKDIEEMIQVNLMGTISLTKAVVPHMIRQKSGCIINISSVIGQHGNIGQSAYAATKAGLVGFTKSLARELGSRGVRVNAIAPGYIDTDLTRRITEQPTSRALIDRIPLQKMGTVEDVAHGAAYLAEARYITGQVLVIDGGLFI
ncbi:3-oxoacyl-reductase [Coemansia reversa NRRL 1564]|uniref:3-oxoacyl-[acyl-carrier-protein] reductase n=1 Tax=Coemansia reversa (strain ATCC 12441 / NRRL 1564) TaxID=763665 RepID=A0A2G5B3Z0_COERN|nr:3-oxoacyl-reductase [Coemansia reversa NRRL 1564]|eukprot:PIA13716.1 3-oxoacyl-reductase [Coemansia reversa NRRL 1564]